MSGIFISYRRDGSAGFAGRLADKLTDRFGRNQVFRDIETIEPGVDFVEAIEKGITSCSVLLVVMGPLWLEFKDARGGRRIDDPEDFVRLEIEAALSRKVRIIPLLVSGAKMPSADKLPESLQPLSRRNALELSDQRWLYDVEQLIATLEKIPEFAPQRDSKGTPDSTEPRRTSTPAASVTGSKPVKIAAGIGVLVIVSIGVITMMPDDTQRTTIRDDEPVTLMAQRAPLEGSESTKSQTATAVTPRLARAPVATVTPAKPTQRDYAPAQSQDLDLSGIWRDSEGTYFDVVQSGRRVTLTGQGISGTGNINGSDLRVTLKDDENIVYQGYYRISDNGNHISGYYIDSNTNQKTHITARQISKAGIAPSASDGMAPIRNIR